MNNVFIRLKSYYPSATTSEKSIIDYITRNPDEVIKDNIRSLSDKTFTSPATIFRFCKKVGFDGYNDLKSSLIYELAINNSSKNELTKTISLETSVKDLITIISTKNQQAILNTSKLMDENLLIRAVEMIENHQKINLYGMGSSLLVAMDMKQKFQRVNKILSLDQDWHMQFLNAKNSDKDTLSIIFSYSGETSEMIKCSNVLSEKNSKIISVTGFLNSSVAKKSDLLLQVAPIENIIRTGALGSRMAQLNIVDLIYSTYILRNYEDSIQTISKNFIDKEVKENE